MREPVRIRVHLGSGEEGERRKVAQEVKRELDSLSVMELHGLMKEGGCPSRLALEARLVAREMSDA